MLGTIKSERHWQWAAYGKHPSARDYFKVGQNFPLLNVFSDWIEKGYQVLAAKNIPAQRVCFWRFWTRESRRQNIICGVVRDSNDGLGRPYPLLIIGTGPLKGWEKLWDLIPFACEKTWRQIEYLSTQMFEDFKRLESEVQNIRPPYAEWSGFIKKREDFVEVNSPGLRELESRASSLSEKAECFIRLDQGPFHDQFEMISLWHFLFKLRGKTVPNSVFMGGTVEKAYIAFFKRPLISSDFIKLWSVSTELIL